MDDTKKLTDLLRLNSTEKDKLLRLARDRKVDPVDLIRALIVVTK